MTHRFLEFGPWKGDIEKRINGSLIAIETGQAIAYALHKLQDRGKFFVDPGIEIYEGQVIGENTRSGDIGVNITKTKKLTNMRATGSDEKMRIAPAIKFSLEEALEYIQEDELVEVCPAVGPASTRLAASALPASSGAPAALLTWTERPATSRPSSVKRLA